MPKSAPSPMNRTAKATEIRLSAPTMARPIAAVMDRPTNKLVATARMIPNDRKASQRMINTTTMVTAVLTYGASRNLAVFDSGPIVRHEIRAPSHIAMGREVLLDRLLAQQTRYSKERRHRLRVPDGLAQRRKTLFDLARRLSRRHLANGVVLGVVGDGVALVINASHHPRIGARHLPDHEEGRLHTFRCENLEDAAGVTRHRTIVECQDDLMVVK